MAMGMGRQMGLRGATRLDGRRGYCAFLAWLLRSAVVMRPVRIHQVDYAFFEHTSLVCFARRSVD